MNALSCRSRVRSCRCQAVSALAPSTVLSRSGVRPVIRPLSSTAAACTMPSGSPAGTAAISSASCAGSVRSQARMLTCAPAWTSSAAGLRRARRGRAAAADQQQPPHPVLGDQPPGHQRTQPAGAAGHRTPSPPRCHGAPGSLPWTTPPGAAGSLPWTTPPGAAGSLPWTTPPRAAGSLPWAGSVRVCGTSRGVNSCRRGKRSPAPRRRPATPAGPPAGPPTHRRRCRCRCRCRCR